MKEVVVLLLDVVQIVLESRVRVGVAVGELVDVVFAIEVEGERHDVVATVIRTAVIVNVLGRNTSPE